jgi:hypothetical protein
MAIGAGELIVAQYNHYCVLPVNPRRHSARARMIFPAGYPLFARIKTAAAGHCPAKSTGTVQRLFLSYCGFFAFQASHACLISCFAARHR